MEIFEAFTSYLLTDTEGIEPKRLDALLNLRTIIGDRLYPYERREDEQGPQIVYQNISDVKYHTLQGQSSFENPVYQFTIYENDPVTIKAIGRLLKTALSDFRGKMGGLNVQHIELLNELLSKYNNSDGSLSCYTLDLEYQIYFDYE